VHTDFSSAALCASRVILPSARFSSAFDYISSSMTATRCNCSLLSGRCRISRCNSSQGAHSFCSNITSSGRPSRSSSAVSAGRAVPGPATSTRIVKHGVYTLFSMVPPGAATPCPPCHSSLAETACYSAARSAPAGHPLSSTQSLQRGRTRHTALAWCTMSAWYSLNNATSAPRADSMAIRKVS